MLSVLKNRKKGKKKIHQKHRSLRSFFSRILVVVRKEEVLAQELLDFRLDWSLNNFGRRMIRGWWWWRWFNYLWHVSCRLLFSAGHRLIQIGDGTTDFNDMRIGRQGLFLGTLSDGIFGHTPTTAIHCDHRGWGLAGRRGLGRGRGPGGGGHGGSGGSLTQGRGGCLGAIGPFSVYNRRGRRYFIAGRWSSAPFSAFIQRS